MEAYIAGVDEVGRGPWAGPVVAAAVILDPKHPIDGLTDSKKLSEKRRTELSDEIKVHALAYAIAEVSAARIDEINILQASLQAMAEAIESLSIVPQEAWVDGRHHPKVSVRTQAFVKGDLTKPVISAASIIAKVYRDTLMIDYDKQYPGYGFAAHKGYGTAQHRRALEQLGPCAIHRKTFKPITKLIQSWPQRLETVE